MARTFSPDFIWATATAGHQVEGNNSNSDTWFAENVKPTVFKEPSLMACNSFELWRKDVDLVAGMNLTAYRFSVEWARIEPEEGVFSEEALAHYEAMVDYCREKGLEALVTFNHFTAPHWFAKKAGWMNPEAPTLFARYCDVVARRIGHKIKAAVTLNEPNIARLLSWIGLPSFIADLERATLEACSVAAGVEKYRLANVIIDEDRDPIEDGIAAGHLAGKAAIKAVCPDLPVGLSIAIIHDVLVEGADPTIRDRKQKEVYDRWLEIARDDDFVGVQNYETHVFDSHGLVRAPEGATTNGMGSAIDPGSLAGAVKYAYERAGAPVWITEHGLLVDDDSQRQKFLPEAIGQLHDLMETGVPVLGYTHWTLLDNFEWIFGYEKKYGLHSVDHKTFERTAKGSASVLAQIARDNGIV
jgi:beta-glucosidase